MEQHKKAFTLSFDDGVVQDRRLVSLLNKYHLKATFHLNSGRLNGGGCVSTKELKTLYAGHEVAVHTVSHPALSSLSKQDMIAEIENDRKALEEYMGYSIRGMAYPGVIGYPLYTEEMIATIKAHTKIQYARATKLTYGFAYPTELLAIHPTAHFCREPERLIQLAEEFIAAEPLAPMLFYVWGHSYELKSEQDWEQFERFCETIAGRDDIFYGTNKAVLLGE